MPYRVPCPRHELFARPPYPFPFFQGRPFVSVLTSTGCSGKCIFCSHRLAPLGRRDTDDVRRELFRINELGIRCVYFQDACFTMDRGAVLATLDQIQELPDPIRWVCSCRVDQVDRELLEKMKATGCIAIQFGVESGNEAILKLLNKNITLQQALGTFQLCRELGIRTHAFFIMGLPMETTETMQQTVEFALKLNPDSASFGVPMFLAGTTLTNKYGGEAFLREGDDVSPARQPRTGILESDLMQALRAAYRRFYFRPAYALRQLGRARNPRDFWVAIRQGVGLLRWIGGGRRS